MRNVFIATSAAFVLTAAPLQAQTPATTGLSIVVIEGEDAVNIIQQKTAVAPIVEVRDRNNLPVSGVAVTFSVGGQGASFGGASSLTVVTNAAGQATAAGLTPTAAGAIQIQATATFQGQTAIATIAQSNVMTAAEVATAGTATGSAGGGSGSGGATTGGAAGGGGGGLSGATLGIIGGVAGAGALVATQAGGGDSPSTSSSSSSPSGTSSTTPPPTTPAPAPGPTSSSFTGPMDGTLTATSTVSVIGEPISTSCTLNLRQTGTVTLRMQTTSAGSISGTFEVNGRQVVSGSTCVGVAPGFADGPVAYTASVEGSGGTVRFTQEFRDSGTVPGASYTNVATLSFTGTVGGGTVTGTLTYNSLVEVRGDGFTSRGTMTGSIPLSLR